MKVHILGLGFYIYCANFNQGTKLENEKAQIPPHRREYFQDKVE